MSREYDKLSEIEKALKRAIETITKGKYDKIDKEYLFKLQEDSEFKTSIDKESIDFKISTMKWIPGNYEPLIGEEIYLSVPLKELVSLSEKEIYIKLLGILNNLQKN